MKTTLFIFVFLVTIGINAQCFQSISVDYQHTLALKTDGSLWSWGNNNSGELGLNTSLAPIYTPRLVSNQPVWAKIFADGGKSFAIKIDGTLWACGDGDYGGLGTGTQNDKYIFTQIGTDTDWDYISAGGGTIALKTNGTLWGWGSNIYGQLNLGVASVQLLPVQISTETNWAQVVAGGNHTLAIKTDGTLWACGLNDKGQLGDGTITNRFNFVQIGTDTNWASIAGGDLFKHSIAMKTDGSIWGWGSNLNDVLGFGLPWEVHTPTQLGTDTNWVKICTGYYFSTALKADGTLWYNDATGFHQIGIATDWDFIDSGDAFYFAMKTDGTLWGDGGNDYGQLGIGSGIQGTSVPTQLSCSAFLGVNEVTSLSKISLYPNPTSDVLFIQNDSNSALEKITVTDIAGKTLLETTTNFSEVNLQAFQSGIYILNLRAEHKTYNYKVVKK
jgi:alpha-tubulin suppressor-like RCC1 family protein